MMWEGLLHVGQGLIAPLYLLFAAQVWIASRKHEDIDPKRRKAMTYLMLVFILCSASGYLSHMLALSVAVQAVIHIALVIVTVGLVTSKAATTFALMLKGDSDGSG